MRVNIMSSIAALLVTASSRAVTAFSTHSITSARAASVSEVIFVPAGARILISCIHTYYRQSSSILLVLSQIKIYSPIQPITTTLGQDRQTNVQWTHAIRR